MGSHEIVVVALIFYLGSLNFFHRLVLELILDLLGSDQPSSFENIVLDLFVLVICSLLDLCSLLLPNLFFLDPFFGLGLLLFLLLLDDLQLVVNASHVLPGELVVYEQHRFLEEVDYLFILQIVEVLLLAFVIEDLCYLFSEESKVFIVFEDLGICLHQLIVPGKPGVCIHKDVLSKYSSNLFSFKPL